jgi:ankyrin repeat protein
MDNLCKQVVIIKKMVMNNFIRLVLVVIFLSSCNKKTNPKLDCLNDDFSFILGSSDKLLCHIYNSDLEEITKILKTLPSDIDKQRKIFFTASKHSNQEVLKYLISLGIDINLTSNKNWNGLNYACGSKNIEAINFLLSKSIKISEKYSPFNNLILDFNRNHKDIVNKLFEKGVHLKTEINLIELGVKANNLSFLKSILNNGININQIDYWGWSGLHHAVYLKREECAQFLLNSNIDCNIETIKRRAFEKDKGIIEIPTKFKAIDIAKRTRSSLSSIIEKSCK